jgi:hypothetical protein
MRIVILLLLVATIAYARVTGVWIDTKYGRVIVQDHDLGDVAHVPLDHIAELTLTRNNAVVADPTTDRPATLIRQLPQLRCMPSDDKTCNWQIICKRQLDDPLGKQKIRTIRGTVTHMPMTCDVSEGDQISSTESLVFGWVQCEETKGGSSGECYPVMLRKADVPKHAPKPTPTPQPKHDYTLHDIPSEWIRLVRGDPNSTTTDQIMHLFSCIIAVYIVLWLVWRFFPWNPRFRHNDQHDDLPAVLPTARQLEKVRGWAVGLELIESQISTLQGKAITVTGDIKSSTATALDENYVHVNKKELEELKQKVISLRTELSKNHETAIKLAGLFQ